MPFTELNMHCNESIVTDIVSTVWFVYSQIMPTILTYYWVCSMQCIQSDIWYSKLVFYSEHSHSEPLDALFPLTLNVIYPSRTCFLDQYPCLSWNCIPISQSDCMVCLSFSSDVRVIIGQQFSLKIKNKPIKPRKKLNESVCFMLSRFYLDNFWQF